MESTAAPLSAEIVTTGTEILLGEIVDTNASWIAQQLRDAGVNLYFKTTVGDNIERLRFVLELGLSRSDILIVTGGLGPTADDITRQAISEATGRELQFDEGALQSLKERFARFGVSMTENNRQQALFPAGSTLIPNPVGTAPGFIVETPDGAIVAVPGVPREMKRLMQDTVLPYLRERSGNEGIIRRRILRTIGIGESTLDARLGELMLRSNPTVGLAAKTAQADIRITARAGSALAADALIEDIAQEIRARVGDHIYSEEAEQSLEAVVATLLEAQHATLAVVEANPDGALAARIRVQDDGSRFLKQAFVVENGALPPELQKQVFGDEDGGHSVDASVIARSLREFAGTTYSLAVLGTTDPDGGIYGTAAGRTWIALAGDGDTTVMELPYGGVDEYTTVRVANQALYLLWQNLLKQ